MFGQDLDAMVEARNAQEWEEINEEPEVPVSLIDSELYDAWCEMSEAYDRMAWACEYADKNQSSRAIYNKILSVMNDLENLQGEIEKMRREVKDL